MGTCSQNGSPDLQYCNRIQNVQLTKCDRWPLAFSSKCRRECRVSDTKHRLTVFEKNIWAYDRRTDMKMGKNRVMRSCIIVFQELTQNTDMVIISIINGKGTYCTTHRVDKNATQI